jgi:Leucine-rich repeat (LRR) protein
MKASYTTQKWVIIKSFIEKMVIAACLVALVALVPLRNALAQGEVYVPEQDSLALVALFNSLNGEHWVNKGGWLVDRVDTWRGVTTENVGTAEDPEYRVVGFSSRDNMTLPGTLPSDVGNLTYLKDFELRNEPLFGELPPEFGQLQYLESLSFRNTQMTGEIPWNSLVNAQSLKEFRIDGGTLFGEIPDIVGNLNMVEFNIDQNFLSGSIPGTISNWTDLERFSLLDNNLTGEVPDMSVFPELDVLRLGDNPFTPGPLWAWLEGMFNLDALFIVNSNRTGEIPNWFFDLVVRNLRIGESNPALENGLGGVLSDDMQNMVALDVLQLEGINWEGDLPEWMSNFNRVDFYNCSFTGEIPGSYASMNRLRIYNCPNIEGGIPAQFETFTGEFEWANDPVDGPWGFDWGKAHMEFTEAFYGNPKASVGQLPDWIGNWGGSSIILRGVGVTGTIPAGLQNKTNLRGLNLSYNPGLTGPIPEWLADFEMTSLNLSHTGLTAPEIPGWMNNSKWNRLSTLGLAGLGMEGELPNWIWDFVELGTLDLSDNNLTGSIPASVGNLTRISTLNLANNQLDGELPASFEDMGYFLGQHSLLRLDLSGNENLTGQLPVRLAESIHMRVLRYNDTKIWAPDDSGFLNFINNVIPENGDRLYPPVYVDVQTSGYVGGPPATASEYLGKPYIFHLSGNYPNPFNPVTIISYEIPAEGHVSLTIYNVLGQKVATLVNEVQAAGSHQVNYDAKSLSSGTYLYRLRADNREMTRSMMLIK